MILYEFIENIELFVLKSLTVSKPMSGWIIDMIEILLNKMRVHYSLKE